uniref:Protein broad-minded n=1 Tax=Cyprinodon variegatus TaxID=28743 RepID=A0A3Q2DIE3_CYPVA
MSKLSADDELQLQTLLKQLLRSISDKISGAPSPESAEEILLCLEETDKNFHNYEFVRYLRQHVESSMGTVVEEEIQNLTRGGQHAVGAAHDTLIQAATRRTRNSAQYRLMIQTLKNTMMVVVESLINKFEEDQLRKEEMNRAMERCQSSSQYADNCSDSDSSFNQSYAFIRQEQLQALAEKLDPSKPKEVRREALQALCGAPLSDVLSCESWNTLQANLCAALTEPDLSVSPHLLVALTVHVLLILHLFTAKSVESGFRSQELSFPTGSATVDINTPQISRLLKQVRLMNDFQKDVTTFWIRHPEKYMEEIIESTFSLLSIYHECGSNGAERTLEPVHLLSLLDIKATWFNKWMHGYYSRAVVFRLLEKKYKSLVGDSVNHVSQLPSCSLFCLSQRSIYTRKELEYSFFVHSLCVLGKLIIYTDGRKLFPVKIRTHKGVVLQHQLINAKFTQLIWNSLVMEVLWMLCERTECAADCLYQTPVIETLLAPVVALLTEQRVCVSHTQITHVPPFIGCKSLYLLFKSENCCHFLWFLLLIWNRLVWEETLLGSLLNFAATPKGLLLLQQTGAIQECVSYMFSRFSKKLQVSRCEKFGYGVMVTQVAATAPGVAALHSSGFVTSLVVELWLALESGADDTRVAHPRPTPMDPIDRSCLKSFLSLVNLLSSSLAVWELLGRQLLANKSEYTLRETPTSIPDLIDRLVAVNSDVKIHSLFHYEQSHTFGLRLLSVLCCCLDSFLLLESQYNICSMLVQRQKENVTDQDTTEGENMKVIIIDSLSVERNHILVRVNVVGGPSERRLPSRVLEEGEDPYSWPMFISYPPPPCYILNLQDFQNNTKGKRYTNFTFSFLYLFPCLAESGITPVYWCTAHYVEMLLKAEVPLVHSAFRMSGFTPSQMCLHWLTQCFWNYLDWSEICMYICTCAVMGPDYQVYLCVAIFKHLQPEILERTQSQELQVFLKEEPIAGFKFSNYLEFMMGLERRYRKIILTDMDNIKNPQE